MLEVPDFQADLHAREIASTLGHLERIDVAVQVADHLGDLGERAGLIEDRHRDQRVEALGILLVDVPGNVDPALHVVELLELRRMDRIDEDAFVGRDDADDLVARHRAALAEIDGQSAAKPTDRDLRRLACFQRRRRP